MENIEKARFIKSSTSLESCPKPVYPEYAFIGRSNVGKSSLLNMLADIKNLAKTSGTPGKTRLINHFLINNKWYMVDLPGYGYIKDARKDKDDILKLITSYILNRENLVCIFILLDCRHEPQVIDLDFIRWTGINKIPFVLCFTKADKISTSMLDKRLKNYRKILLESWQTLPHIFITSSVKKSGREEIVKFILDTNRTVNI
ncbi:MAG: YihA family ribosome biogenesis GTP-binding protein [Bacteroidales bacterium]|nr:MAG: YihA family ribosome biogenesis GTP-binding protein [Bacteroidales bacterium]